MLACISAFGESGRGLGVPRKFFEESRKCGVGLVVYLRPRTAYSEAEKAFSKERRGELFPLLNEHLVNGSSVGVVAFYKEHLGLHERHALHLRGRGVFRQELVQLVEQPLVVGVVKNVKTGKSRIATLRRGGEVGDDLLVDFQRFGLLAKLAV